MMIAGIILLILGISLAIVTTNMDNASTYLVAGSFLMFVVGLLMVENTIKKNRAKKKS